MPVDPAASSIVLIGPSGAGKSEVGRQLASALGRPLVDTDALIVEREGRSIAEIFEDGGEPAFRVIESEVVASAASTPGSVISTGGGAVLDPANVEKLSGTGPVVYLQVSPEVAAARLGAAADRPLLNGLEVRERLEKIILEREAAYLAAADYVVDADRPAEDVVNVLVGIWESVRDPSSEPARKWRLRP